MGLSSTVLWHQTRKDAFFKILSSKKLYFSYSNEYVLSGNQEQPTAFPMISLCDLPLSEFASNNWTYGDFAIGLSRAWGIKNGVNPVCYCQEGSFFLQQLLGCFKGQLPLNLASKILNCCAYLKFVQGPLTTSNKKFKNYRFYDEREVRLVIDSQVKEIKFMLDKDGYEQYKKEHKSSLIDKFVSFDSEDILYVVANTQKNISEAKRVLSKDGDKIDHIVFLTKEQILEDVIGSNHNEEDVNIEQKQFDDLLNAISQVSHQILEQSKKQ